MLKIGNSLTSKTQIEKRVIIMARACHCSGASASLQWRGCAIAVARLSQRVVYPRFSLQKVYDSMLLDTTFVEKHQTYIVQVESNPCTRVCHNRLPPLFLFLGSIGKGYYQTGTQTCLYTHLLEDFFIMRGMSNMYQLR